MAASSFSALLGIPAGYPLLGAQGLSSELAPGQPLWSVSLRFPEAEEGGG